MKYAFCIAFLFMWSMALAQSDTSLWLVPRMFSYKFIKHADNHIVNDHKLYPAFEKLFNSHNPKRGAVNIIHIGDSHLQADMITSVLRNGFQNRFGNAGRGLVFPQQLAKSNAPSDIASSSNITWKYNRLAHPENPTTTGISGFGIHTTQPNAVVRMTLKPVDSMQNYFNHLKFFLGANENCYELKTDANADPIKQNTRSGTDTPSLVFDLPGLTSSFELSECSPRQPGDSFSLYGVYMFRTDVPGVVYNTIGVNGAEYDQFNRNPLFWHQLPTLQGDLFIVSMGTNEAQNLSFNEDSFIVKCNSFLAQIRTAAPNCQILITTPPVSYYKGKAPNKVLDKVTKALIRFCKTNDLPYWDLYHISGGLAGSLSWKKNKLLARDLVHFQHEGYRLQGQLLLHALASSYNDFLKQHLKKITSVPKSAPRKPTVKPTTKPPTPKSVDTTSKAPPPPVTAPAKQHKVKVIEEY